MPDTEMQLVPGWSVSGTTYAEFSFLVLRCSWLWVGAHQGSLTQY